MLGTKQFLESLSVRQVCNNQPAGKQRVPVSCGEVVKYHNVVSPSFSKGPYHVASYIACAAGDQNLQCIISISLELFGFLRLCPRDLPRPDLYCRVSCIDNQSAVFDDKGIVVCGMICGDDQTI